MIAYLPESISRSIYIKLSGTFFKNIATPAFGSPPQQASNNTFETLAQQETPTFGNLAQQQSFSATPFA